MSSDLLKVTGKDVDSKAHPVNSRSLIAIVLLVIVFFGLIRFRLRDFPLERDEGEYAYAGQLILQGVAPYQLAYNMKLPGTYIAYAIEMLIFGQNAAGIHLGLIFVNAATSILLGMLALKLFGRIAGVCAATSYAALSTSASVLGFAGHATHFVVLPAVAGLLLLLRSRESQKITDIFFSGLLLGMAFIMKQPGLLFSIFGGLFLLYSEIESKPVDWKKLVSHMVAYSLGAVLPFAFVCLWLFKAGVFSKFWFWTFTYAKTYGTLVRPAQAIANFRAMFPSVVGSSLLLWLLAALGVASLIWNRRPAKQTVFVLGFLLFSSVAVCPGFYFREHYFILILPAVAIFVGLAIEAISGSVKRHASPRAAHSVSALVLLFAITYPAYAQRKLFFSATPTEASRQIYGVNPFPESRVVADYIKANSSPSDKIVVIGSEPEIYFYSGRHSATGYIYTYGLVENQKFALQMQKEMIAEIETANPEYVVAVRVPTSWLQQPGSPSLIFSWAGEYIQNFDLVGVADIRKQSQFVFGDESRSYVPKSSYAMFVFRRRHKN